MPKRSLGLLAVVATAIAACTAACESSTNNGPSGLPGSSGTSAPAPGTSGNIGDGGGTPLEDAGEGGAPVAEAGADADADAAAQCTWTASGAQVASGTCTMLVGYSQNHDQLGFAFTGTPNAINFIGDLAGKMTLTAGTYTLVDSPQASGKLVAGTPRWVMCNDGNCTDGMGNPIPNQGTFTLTITDPGPATMNVFWYAAHGTLDMTLPFDPNTGASGDVSFHATF